MMTEDYISFEIAKLLKEKGFDIPLNYYYTNDGRKNYSITYNWNQVPGDFPVYSCPTLQMVMKWLREVHNKSIEVRSQGLKSTGLRWVTEIYNLKNQDEEYHNPFTKPSYEEACEAGIKYCLENLI